MALPNPNFVAVSGGFQSNAAASSTDGITWPLGHCHQVLIGNPSPMENQLLQINTQWKNKYKKYTLDCNNLKDLIQCPQTIG
jgi:uncharacterized protein (DUF697 family)